MLLELKNKNNGDTNFIKISDLSENDIKTNDIQYRTLNGSYHYIKIDGEYFIKTNGYGEKKYFDSIEELKKSF